MSEKNQLSAYLDVLKGRYKLGLAIVVLVTALVGFKQFLKPDMYHAEVVLLPATGENDLMALQASLAGSFFGIGGGGQASKLKTYLKSRTFAERVVRRFDLLHYYFSDQWDDARKQWKEGVVKPPKEADAVGIFMDQLIVDQRPSDNAMLVRITSTDKDIVGPLANGVVDELQSYTNENSLSSTKKERLFIERQLKERKKEFLDASKEIASFYQNNNVSATYAKIDVPISWSESLEGIKSEDPALADRQQDMRKELTDLKNKAAKINDQAHKSEIVTGVPQQVYLNYQQQKGKVLSSLISLLSQQYEMAKVREVKEDSSFQVIDAAIPPDHPSGPRRLQATIYGFIFSVFLAVFVMFTVEVAVKLRKGQQ